MPFDSDVVISRTKARYDLQQIADRTTERVKARVSSRAIPPGAFTGLFSAIAAFIEALLSGCRENAIQKTLRKAERNDRYRRQVEKYIVEDTMGEIDLETAGDIVAVGLETPEAEFVEIANLQARL